LGRFRSAQTKGAICRTRLKHFVRKSPILDGASQHHARCFRMIFWFDRRMASNSLCDVERFSTNWRDFCLGWRISSRRLCFDPKREKSHFRISGPDNVLQWRATVGDRLPLKQYLAASHIVVATHAGVQTIPDKQLAAVGANAARVFGCLTSAWLGSCPSGHGTRPYAN
jgi:hypothetical protein